jgi:hypothetical protein
MVRRNNAGAGAMAKAVFHKNQRVFVRPVGTWANIERVIPVWAKGLEEPVRITYDVGLGREFGASELAAEQMDQSASAPESGTWRVMRARNRWQEPQDCGHHPHPGTFPVVVTDEQDWGGWRVPAAEYDREPSKIEFQARLIVGAPTLMVIADRLARFAGETQEAPASVIALGKQAANVLRYIRELDPEQRAHAAE